MVVRRFAEGPRRPEPETGARAWRRVLTVESVKPWAGLEVLDLALAQLKPSRAAVFPT